MFWTYINQNVSAILEILETFWIDSIQNTKKSSKGSPKVSKIAPKRVVFRQNSQNWQFRWGGLWLEFAPTP